MKRSGSVKKEGLRYSEKKAKLLKKSNISQYNGVIDNMSKSTTACKRCKQKKIKCDKLLPGCKKCITANEPCVSIDPATGKDVPRSYILFLEDTLSVLMKKLKENGIDPSSIRSNLPSSSQDPPYNGPVPDGVNTSNVDYKLSNSDLLGKYLINKGKQFSGSPESFTFKKPIRQVVPSGSFPETGSAMQYNTRHIEFSKSNDNISKLASMNSSDSNSFLGDSSGVSFAKLVFTAANFEPDSVVEDSDDDIKEREDKINEYDTDDIATKKENFADLFELPERKEAELLIIRYFTDTNSQIPIFHREYFLKKYFEPIYGPWDHRISLTSDHTSINTDFVVPKSLCSMDTDEGESKSVDRTPIYELWKKSKKSKMTLEIPARIRIPLFFLNMVFAIGHATRVLESTISKVVSFKRRATYFTDSLFSSSDRLEALAGTLLVVLYSIMRPNIPGVWYIMGSVLRLTVDLGLHTEKLNLTYEPFVRDMRRRLFWSVYSLDRQICTYFGRPFGIPEESITTRYPSLLDDANILPTKETENTTQDYSDEINLSVSTKVISISMFKIRQIQASIVKVLYAPNSELPRQFSDIEDWRESIRHSLDNWYFNEIPRSFEAMNCDFNTFLFDLNYHYSKLILYGLSPKCPILTDEAFKVVFESTKGTIDVFHNLCITKKLSYTWVAVHNIFMTGMTYLYVIYYSDDFIVKDEATVKQYTAKVLNVLNNLIGTCDAAKNCYKIYKMLSAAVIKLKFDTKNNTIKREINEESNSYSLLDGSLNLPLDQFFNELEKVNDGPVFGMKDIILEDSDHPPTEPTNFEVREDEKSLLEEPRNKEAVKETLQQDDQNIMDLLYQVSSQSIWDEFFVKGNNKDEKNLSQIFH